MKRGRAVPLGRIHVRPSLDESPQPILIAVLRRLNQRGASGGAHEEYGKRQRD